MWWAVRLVVAQKLAVRIPDAPSPCDEIQKGARETTMSVVRLLSGQYSHSEVYTTHETPWKPHVLLVRWLAVENLLQKRTQQGSMECGNVAARMKCGGCPLAHQ
jgi:hypothetical protein